ncbi:N-acetyltransferase (plasmid) [Duffyella gerundensis]|uniref:N-acetyltransferase n=1 Tax=Duffyella gerundensis TaxID=1619313 RepID=A0A0U5EEP3_9GAMM|nr:arylamine N-acetyltransferase [Duffyella gerundensis]CUU26077.1 N-acetyltransferase [Duffyella gerundensis]
MHAQSALQRFCDTFSFTPDMSANLPALQALQQFYVQHLPFENIDVLLGKPISIEPADVVEKLLIKRRGGYCFEHNTLFRLLLEAMGFNVSTHLARVVWGAAENAASPETHMVLLAELQGRHYLTDVGFGGVSLTRPLLLEPGEQHGFMLKQDDSGDWLLAANLNDKAHPMYRFHQRACEAVDIVVANHFVSTWPQSHFRHHLLMARIIDGVQVNMSDWRQTTHGETRREMHVQNFAEFCSQVKALFTDEQAISEAELEVIYRRVGQ